MTTPRALRLNPSDNVIIAVDEIVAGATPENVTARQRVPKGHKMASRPRRRRRPDPQVRTDHRLRVASDRARRMGA